MPKISVVIPLYNKEKSIASTLRTVLNQTFSDYEIVIVNDGSTDYSVAEAGKVQDDRIRLIHQQNAGVSAARNRGIEEAKGELIAFWMPMTNGVLSIYLHNIIFIRNILNVMFLHVIMKFRTFIRIELLLQYGGSHLRRRMGYLTIILK